MVNGRLEGRVALITGAARGIGRATAERFRAEGAIVIGWDRVALPAFDTPGPAWHHAVVDVTDRVAVRTGLEAALAAAGTIDILVNNAGYSPVPAGLEQLSADVFDMTVDVNLRAALRCTQAVLPVMRARRRGRILNLSSVLAAHGVPGYTVYTATKSALEGMTRTWARELGPDGITVNAVRPGYIRTAMTAGSGPTFEAEVQARTPLGRLGDPADVAAALAWLASDDAAFVTGIVLPIDGGFEP